jgi:hypothetical protein
MVGMKIMVVIKNVEAKEGIVIKLYLCVYKSGVYLD